MPVLTLPQSVLNVRLSGRMSNLHSKRFITGKNGTHYSRSRSKVKGNGSVLNVRLSGRMSNLHSKRFITGKNGTHYSRSRSKVKGNGSVLNVRLSGADVIPADADGRQAEVV